MLRPYLNIWEWELIFGRSVKAISSSGIRSPWLQVKFIYSEKATNFCEISTEDLTGTTYDKSMVKILQNFVAFLEYIYFKNEKGCQPIVPI